MLGKNFWFGFEKAGAIGPDKMLSKIKSVLPSHAELPSKVVDNFKKLPGHMRGSTYTTLRRHKMTPEKLKKLQPGEQMRFEEQLAKGQKEEAPYIPGRIKDYLEKE